VKSWGEKGTGPGQFRRRTPIAIDRNNNIYVGRLADEQAGPGVRHGRKFLRMFTIDVRPIR